MPSVTRISMSQSCNILLFGTTSAVLFLVTVKSKFSALKLLSILTLKDFIAEDAWWIVKQGTIARHKKRRIQAPFFIFDSLGVTH